MAEAFLQVVLDNLSSLIKEEIGLILGVDDEMKKLSSTLTTIQDVLEDAEDKQIESKQIRDWLRKLNVLAYEIDDILDECNTHVSKLNHSHSKFSRYSIKKILYRHKIGRKMKQVTEKLDSVAAERAKFRLREMPVDRPREVAAWREMDSLLNDSDSIYGRQEDREKIVKMLVDDAREKQHMSVLPIIVVGGLGKTTLAQLVYNDPRVEKHFEKRIWVCVSDDFEIKTLVGKMIESGTGTRKASNLQHLDALLLLLMEMLSQKRYLVVLDDVWNDDQQKWYELEDILSCGSTGASIIVTTRLKKVANIMGTLPPHCLKGLSDENCWMLLRQRAFGPEEEVHPQLEAIGKQIAKRCAGVPLAAKALGGILRFKRTEKEWMSVRESEIYKLAPEESLIIPALRLSYHHLPLELRQCFAYFAAFPKDDAVEKEELIRLWMAHGFISSKGTLQVEDIGNEICNELILRSLFQPHDNGKISMHDLVHDLAQSVMENKVPGIQTKRNISSASTIRQVNLKQRNVLFPKSFQQDMDISSILEHKSLRVLDASDSGIKDLPPSIGNLIHLRYLNLRWSKICTLPNSLCSLWNLQILNLDYCRNLVALPKNMRYLRNLQHLCLDGCNSLSEMPSQMRELSLLKTLSRYVVGLNKGNQLEELQCLNLISGKLEIRHLERVKDHIDAKKANIAEKRNLRHLSLNWERNSLSELGEDVDERVLEALEPHQDIEKLSISGYNGRYFPLWMTNSSFGKILQISIENCQNCRRFPNLGELPHLRKLMLANVGGVDYIFEDEEVGSSNPVPKVQFLALQELYLFDLPNLKGLSKGRLPELPHLRELTLKNVGVDYIFEDEEVGSSNPVPKVQFLALQELNLFNLPNLKGLSKGRLPELPHLRELTLKNVGVDYIFEDEEVGSSNPVPKVQFLALQELNLFNLPNLKGLSKGRLPELPHLRKLRLANAGVDYIFEDEEVGSSNPVLKQQFLALEELNLSDLPNLKGLSKGRLPELPHLRKLRLANAGVDYIFEDEEVGSSNPVPRLQFLALEGLDLVDLPNLKGLSKEQQSKEAFSNLKKLRMKFCSSFILPPPSSLKKLEELECSSSTLALFSEPDTLTTLSVYNEEKMPCFPIETLVKFTNLRLLTISGAKELSVPQGGLQALNNLEFLKIEDCETMRCIPEGLLRHLTALQKLTIEWCPELVELPEEIKHLHYLREIELVSLRKMACLPQAIQHLSSLTTLWLRGLPDLESLPVCLDQLTSLYVMHCAKVASLPSALPNLKELFVRECPELERRCERGSGEEWHKIAHIPFLRIGE